MGRITDFLRGPVGQIFIMALLAFVIRSAISTPANRVATIDVPFTDGQVEGAVNFMADAVMQTVDETIAHFSLSSLTLLIFTGLLMLRLLGELSEG